MKNFDTITAYKCKKCGAVVEIAAVHECGVRDVTGCMPAIIPIVVEYTNQAAAGNP